MNLHGHAGKGHLEAVQAYLEEHPGPDVRDELGNTLLHYAARYGHPPLADFLLRAGADPKAENRQGQTPFQAALETTAEPAVRADLVRIFLERGADPEHVDSTGISVLHLARLRSLSELAATMERPAEPPPLAPPLPFLRPYRKESWGETVARWWKSLAGG